MENHYPAAVVKVNQATMVIVEEKQGTPHTPTPYSDGTYYDLNNYLLLLYKINKDYNPTLLLTLTPARSTSTTPKQTTTTNCHPIFSAATAPPMTPMR